MDVKDLIGYSQVVRRLYFDTLAKLPWAEVVASRGLSFDCLRDVFLHLTLVEDRWINYIIPGRFSEWVDPDFDSFTDMESLKNYMQKVHNNTEKYLSTLSTQELYRQIEVPWGDKPYIKLKIEDVLTHMVMEDMVHYGELSAAFWQMNLEAPYRAFWRYQSLKKQNTLKC
jgi:uncharacterized damage-inducible protein DinB